MPRNTMDGLWETHSQQPRIHMIYKCKYFAKSARRSPTMIWRASYPLILGYVYFPNIA